MYLVDQEARRGAVGWAACRRGEGMETGEGEGEDGGKHTTTKGECCRWRRMGKRE